MNEMQADKHIIEHWAQGGFEGKGIIYPGAAYLESKEPAWGKTRFELERHLREDNESEGKVGTSSFLLFQSRLYSVIGAREANAAN